MTNNFVNVSWGIYFGGVTANLTFVRGTQQLNVSKYDRIVSDGFLYALETCLDNLELP